MISALICAKNEELFIKGCIERILPYVEEVIFVDNSSIDKTREIVENLKNPKIKILHYKETDNMGELRQVSLEQATKDWIWQIDADEWYEKDACDAIVDAVNAPGEAISFRVGYHQLSWREGYAQANFNHFPDRLYKREVVDRYDGLLPNDMTKVKKEFYIFRPFLEYDNQQDKSFENPKQPILPVKYYHLARTKGYNYEFNKWLRYNVINHKEDLEKLKINTKINQWVSGLYELEEIKVPFTIPRLAPKVSIIIPNYNYAQYVGKAIESSLNQTVKPFEVIVVDDFSTDNSCDVISKYPVQLVRQPHNSGVAAARNAGIYTSTGDYFICLDADDELAPNYIEETLKEMQGDIQIVYTDLEFIGDNQGINPYPEFSSEGLKQAQILPSACALIDRRVFELSGGFDLNAWYEDYDFWLRLDKLGFHFKHIDKPLFRYRTHGNSRIKMLDTKQAYGFQQLREKYGKR